jgi:hypothetical protein
MAQDGTGTTTRKVARRWLQIANSVLAEIGEEVAGAWVVVVGLVLMLGFQVAAIAASFAIGFGAAWVVAGERKTLAGVLVFLGATSVSGLFFARYVWPSLKACLHRASGALTDRSQPIK